jgi:hypothetical protein
MRWDQLATALEPLARSPRLLGVSIADVRPDLDPTGNLAVHVLEVLERHPAVIGGNQVGRQLPGARDSAGCGGDTVDAGWACKPSGAVRAMEPRIDRTQFGSVTIDGEVFDHDVIIRLGGQVEKRKKKLSKAVYGTSHTISLAEAKHLYQDGAVRLLIGAGQNGRVGLSEEAATYFARQRCQVELLPTPEVIPVWNQAEGAVIGLVHVTC